MDVWELILVGLMVVGLLLVLKFAAWLFKGFATVVSLLLKPDEGVERKHLRPKGLGMKFFVGLNWDKARKMYIPGRRLK